MSRGERMIVIGTIGVVLLILLLETIAPREPDWRDSFSAYKRTPHGCALVVERMSDLFPQGVTNVHDPIYMTAQTRLALDSTAPRVNHVFVDESIDWDDLDREHLLKMVEHGDNAFICARHFWNNGLLLDTLGLSVDYRYTPMEWDEGVGQMQRTDTVEIRFTAWPLNEDSAARFTKGDFDYMIESFRIDSTEVLAVKTERDSAAGTQRYPVLVRIRWGKGHIYVCTVPNAFTNYALLKPSSRGFMEGALSLLPDRPVLWDEFYKTGRRQPQTPLRFILDKAPLKRAYWTMIGILFLTVFVYARRRQRAIPELEPVKNTSKEFAETIGRLYFFKGDHTDLAKKMCLYFKDELRQRLYLRRNVWDDEAIEHVAGRTGIPVEQWQSTFRLLAHYESTPYVSEEQLMQLNKTLSRVREQLR